MKKENTRGEHHTKYSMTNKFGFDQTKDNPIPKLEVFEKVQEGCEMYMNQLDNDGHCAESDEYVVALAFFEDYLEELRSQDNFVDRVEQSIKIIGKDRKYE